MLRCVSMEQPKQSWIFLSADEVLGLLWQHVWRQNNNKRKPKTKKQNGKEILGGENLMASPRCWAWGWQCIAWAIEGARGFGEAGFIPPYIYQRQLLFPLFLNPEAEQRGIDLHVVRFWLPPHDQLLTFFTQVNPHRAFVNTGLMECFAFCFFSFLKWIKTIRVWFVNDDVHESFTQWCSAQLWRCWAVPSCCWRSKADCCHPQQVSQWALQAFPTFIPRSPVPNSLLIYLLFS